MTTQLTFNHTTFTPIMQDNQLWLSSSELAVALGYKDRCSINKIYERNYDEFTENMSRVTKSVTREVKLTSRGNIKAESRIFSLRGAHLIAMFSRTSFAKAFRKWVLDILDKEVQLPKIEEKPSEVILSTLTLPDIMNSETGDWVLRKSGEGIRATPIPNRSVVSLDSVRYIKRDMQQVAGLLLDLDKRMRVFMGEYSLDKLKEPLT